MPAQGLVSAEAAARFLQVAMMNLPPANLVGLSAMPAGTGALPMAGPGLRSTGHSRCSHSPRSYTGTLCCFTFRPKSRMPGRMQSHACHTEGKPAETTCHRKSASQRCPPSTCAHRCRLGWGSYDQVECKAGCYVSLWGSSGYSSWGGLHSLIEWPSNPPRGDRDRHGGRDEYGDPKRAICSSRRPYLRDCCTDTTVPCIKAVTLALPERSFSTRQQGLFASDCFHEGGLRVLRL